ncbi:MAG: hypothetical protein WCC54_19875, partial [Pseudolabrys sp.]
RETTGRFSFGTVTRIQMRRSLFWKATLRIDFRDGAVHVSAGEMFVVPKGVDHKPYAEHEVKLLLIEPRGVLNTGDKGGDRTAENDVWI